MASSSGATLRTQLLNEAFAGNLQRFKKSAEELDDGKGVAETVASVRSAKCLSALHHAAMGGNLNICRYLIHDLNLDVNIRGDKKGETPLLLASLGGQKSIVAYFLEMGGNPEVRDEKGLTPLHHATVQGHGELVHLLLSHGADVNAISSEGTPLERAACRSPEIVKILLDHHANPNLCSSRAYTPLSYAVAADSLQCVEFLLEAGANPDRAGASGVTPLLIAVCKGRTEIIRCLLRYGANPDLVGEEGLKPLEVAAICANHHCAKVLFPVTSPISSYPDWSFAGVIKHVHSREARAQRDLKNEELFRGAKLTGDDAFHEKDYRMAILAYSRAIVEDPSSAVALSNRSLCWARLKSGQAALTDAMQCITLKPDWPKGYYRAGIAWNILENFDRAADSFSKGLKLDPKSKELQKAYQEAVEARIEAMNINM